MSSDPVPPAKTVASRFADLRTRLISALIVGAVALVCMWLGGIWLAILASVAAGLMMSEWRVISAGGLVAPVRSGATFIVAAAGVPVVAWIAGSWMAIGFLVGLGLAGLALDALRGARQAGFWALAGALYIGAAALAFVSLRAIEPFGFVSILWAALVVIAADVGGYFAGRTIGGPKLWPSVSPKKTWAGLGGAMVLALLTGAIFSGATTGTYLTQVCAVSVIAAVLAQAGDLGESALKRHFGVKDAGTILPGHGGVLDRLDGHMVAILVAATVTFSRGQAVFVW